MNRAPPMSSAQMEQQFQARITQAKEAARMASIAAASRGQQTPYAAPFASVAAVPGVPLRPPPIGPPAITAPDAFAVPPEVKNRIDRLVEFVARNGDAFETTARQRERDNPDFAFLRPGGPFSDYYQWKKQQMCANQQPPVGPALGFAPAPPRAPFGSPNAVSIPPTATDPLGDMAVGAMANVCKYARVSGVPAYAPIPRAIIENVGSLPPVEPARLEIRLTEFYRDEQSRQETAA